jgi:uncharacterized membrane protein YfcA
LIYGSRRRSIRDVSVSVLLGAALIGMGVGYLSGAFGKGGSAIATPLLHLLGVPAMVAIASPLPATIPSTLLAGRVYGRAGNVDRRVVRIGLPIGLALTVVGALLTRWIPGGPLVIVTDVVVLACALRVLSVRPAPGDGEHGPGRDPSVVEAPAGKIVAVVGAVGLVSGLLGNSGGFLLAPLFAGVLGLPIHRALGTSLVLAACLAVPGTLVHAGLGHVDWSLTLAFGVASVPAASAGARLALRTKARPLTLAYGAGMATLAGGLLAFAH